MEIYSSVLSILFGLLSFVFTVAIFSISISESFKKPDIEMEGGEEEEKEKSKVDELFGHLKKTSKFAPLIHIFFLLQRIIIIALILKLETSGVLQIIIFGSFTFLKVLFFGIVRPIEDLKLNFQEFFNEAITFLITALFIAYKNVSSEFTKIGVPDTVGYICIALILCRHDFLFYSHIYNTFYLKYKYLDIVTN